jgi:O-antigen ligase
VVIALTPQKEQTVRYLTLIIAAWGVVNLFATIAGWAGVGWQYGGDAVYTSHRAIGFMGHSTTMGLYFLVSLNAIHILYLQEHKPFLRTIWLALGIGVVIGLMGTLSRGAIGAWIISFLWIQWRLGGMRISTLFSIAGLLIVVIGVASLLSLDSLVLSRFTVMDKDISAQSRIPLIEMALDRFSMAPLFGIGMGQRGMPHLEAHNTFMQVLMETGIFGFIAFIVLLWKSYSGLKRRYRYAARERSMAAAYYFGFQVSLVAILIDGLTHVFYFVMPLWVIIGIAFLL